MSKIADLINDNFESYPQGYFNYEQFTNDLLELLESCKPEEKKDRTGETPEGTTFHKPDGSWITAEDYGYNTATQQYHSNISKLFEVEG